MNKFDEQLYAVIRLLRPAVRHIGTNVELKSRALGLSTGMRATLEILIENGPQTVPDIARMLLVERQYIQRSVNDLLAKGMVTREKNPNHKRSFLIATTKEGHGAFAKLKTVESATLQELEGQIPLADLNASYNTLKSLTDHFIALNKKEGAEND